MARTITLLFLVALLSAQCKKEKNTKKPVVFAGIGGMRHWHRSHFYEASGFHFPTPIYENWMLSDTTYEITILDDSTIRFVDGAYEYDAKHSTPQVQYFGLGYELFVNGRGGGIAYFHDKDSIAWGQIDLHGTSDYWRRDDRWYTY